MQWGLSFFCFIFSFFLIFFLTYSFFLQLPSTEWGTCQQNNLDNCNGGTTTQQFLGCYISLWHECSDEVITTPIRFFFSHQHFILIFISPRNLVRPVGCAQTGTIILKFALRILLMSRFLFFFFTNIDFIVLLNSFCL